VFVTTPFVASPESVTEVPVKAAKVPAAGVVAPITVPFIPVDVVLKFPEVNVRLLAPVLIDEAPRPVSDSAPEVPVRLTAPVVKVKPLLAVKVCVEVSAPPLVVVTPEVPIAILFVLVVPILIAPLVEVPVPAVKVRFPPIEVVPDSAPPLRVKRAPVPELAVFVPGPIVNPVVLLPPAVVKSCVCPPATVTTPVELTLKSEEVKVREFAPRFQVEGEAPVKFNAPEELRVTVPVPCPKFVVPVEESELKAPVPGVVAPIAVPLIPVAVVLKLLDVKVMALEPALTDEAPRPERANAPEVPVRFNAPVV